MDWLTQPVRKQVLSPLSPLSGPTCHCFVIHASLCVFISSSPNWMCSSRCKTGHVTVARSRRASEASPVMWQMRDVWCFNGVSEPRRTNPFFSLLTNWERERERGERESKLALVIVTIRLLLPLLSHFPVGAEVCTLRWSFSGLQLKECFESHIHSPGGVEKWAHSCSNEDRWNWTIYVF